MESSERGDIVSRFRKIPPYPIDAPAFDRVMDIINRPVLRWLDPRPEELKQHSVRVFVTGHMVDNPAWNMNPSRFPDTDEALDAATTETHEKLDQIYGEALQKWMNLELVFCSGTAGMDLIALEWAAGKISTMLDNGIAPNVSVRVFLPYNVDTFRSDAVAYGNHAQRWQAIFAGLQAMNLIVEPEFRDTSRRKLHPEPPSKEAVNEEIIRRYGDQAGHYTVYDELNDRMVRLLRKGDYVLALWDGKQPRARGGTLDALYKAHRRIQDDSHIIFIKDEENVILPNKQAYRNGAGRTIQEALQVRNDVRRG